MFRYSKKGKDSEVPEVFRMPLSVKTSHNSCRPRQSPYTREFSLPPELPDLHPTANWSSDTPYTSPDAFP